MTTRANETTRPNEKVQLWQNGIMVTVIPKMEATELINEGTYRVINDQAIEWIGA